MFSCEYCEIFKNSFFHRIPPVGASVAICDTVSSSEVAKISNSYFEFVKYNRMVNDLA